MGYPTSGGRPKTPFAQNACQARKSKVSLEICEIAFRTELSFRNASISAVFVVTGAFRGLKWSLGLPHRCAGFQPECRRNEFEGIGGNSRGFEGTRGKSLGPCSTGPNKPSFEGNGPQKSACKRPPQGQNKPDFEGDGLQIFPRQLLRAQVAHYAWDCPQSRLLWIASIFKLLNSEVPAIMKSSKTTKTIENFQKNCNKKQKNKKQLQNCPKQAVSAISCSPCQDAKGSMLQLFQVSSVPCAFCKPDPIQNHGKAFLRSATC